METFNAIYSVATEKLLLWHSLADSLISMLLWHFCYDQLYSPSNGGQMKLNSRKETFRHTATQSTCILVLIYGLECFSLPKRNLKSLDFAVTRFLMKLFRSSNTEVIAECQRYIGFSLPSELIEKKKNKLVHNYSNMSSFQVCYCYFVTVDISCSLRML